MFITGLGTFRTQSCYKDRMYRKNNRLELKRFKLYRTKFNKKYFKLHSEFLTKKTLIKESLSQDKTIIIITIMLVNIFFLFEK